LAISGSAGSVPTTWGCSTTGCSIPPTVG
jgi:hypothetical protein